MIRLIEENLVRQNKAMMLLFFLLEEEFSRLMKSNPQGVSQIELSIQELMRQIGAERLSLRRMVDAQKPGVQRVSGLFDTIDAEEQENFEKLIDMLDETEQKCAQQAGKNNQLAMALFDQSKSLLEFMHNEIKPKNNTAYAASGRYGQAATGARLLNGRI